VITTTDSSVQNLHLAMKKNGGDNNLSSNRKNGDGEWVSFDGGSLFVCDTDTTTTTIEHQQLDTQIQRQPLPLYKRPGSSITVVVQILILVIALFYGLVCGSEIYMDMAVGKEHQPSQSSNGIIPVPMTITNYDETTQHSTTNLVTSEEGIFE
jgi:hypothetical protein